MKKRETVFNKRVKNFLALTRLTRAVDDIPIPSPDEAKSIVNAKKPVTCCKSCYKVFDDEYNFCPWCGSKKELTRNVFEEDVVDDDFDEFLASLDKTEKGYSDEMKKQTAIEFLQERENES
ncbi:hypothetical protein [Eubacterium oxidoreducens]|uniref:Zinc-ribbon domain-containing protein n=1 Tax=Eubacterium oxidoreducens TaxID=1732 RepID=A0A1G6C3J6_EUBOX|nr:hypothetical protein [Eubacterium oxidoreducens]SDB27449.1 hypothetical protein SAMN02910417_02024 [Eubacterium oxidoreducens]